VDVSRGNTGGYADVETNLTKSCLVNGAVRFEHYTDFGSKLSSKLALRYHQRRSWCCAER
jgi:iron complex outermembrane receptor protein